MGLLSVLVAALVGYAFGAAWYMALSKPWMKAVGLTEDTIDRKDPAPFIVAFLMAVVVAGMMRHILAMGGLDGFFASLMTGFGLGAFVAMPWMVNNIMFGERDRNLIWIDGGYAVGGCTVIGAVLGLF